MESRVKTNRTQLLAGVALVLANRFLRRIKLRPARDGWRRTACLVLRGDHAKFVLSTFQLHIPSDEPASNGRTIEQLHQHLTKRLAAFLQTESAFHLLIRHGLDEHRLEPHPGPSYTLGFQPWVDGPSRFIRPESWNGEHGCQTGQGASPVFEFIGRIHPEGFADLWVRVNHVAADGVPTQELLTRLEQAWGVKAPLVFPAGTEFEPHTVPRPSPGRAGTAEVQTFIDFTKLLAWRKRENAKLAEPMTFSAALLWWLAQNETFSGLYLGTTIELPSVDGLPRGVGVVVVRPADYFDRPDGLVRYVADFNREMALTRQRKSDGCKTLDAAAYVPAPLAEALLRHGLDEGKRAFGSLGLTIVKDAKVFGAPLADTGHPDGFIAIGSVSCENSDGHSVGCVIVKGPAQRIAPYARVLQESLARVPATAGNE
jgi:hypothetical protein